MIGLDTNVLIRYLTRDDPAQAAKAQECIRTQCSAKVPCLISGIVLCELVWVLESSYGLEKDVVADMLEKIFRTCQFQLDDRDFVWAALQDYRASRADFADCLMGHMNRRSGCVHTVTFDRSASRLVYFSLL